jgi:hypothetical protein
MKSLDIFIDFLFAVAMAVGSTQLLSEITTRNIPGGKRQPACKADKFTAFCEPVSRTCGSLDLLQPYGHSRPVTGTMYISTIDAKILKMLK